MRFISRLIWFALSALVAVLLAGFVAANSMPVQVQFWPVQTTVHGELWMFVLGGLGLGISVGALIFWLHGLGLRARLWSKSRRIAELEARIEKTERRDDDNLPESYHQSAG